MNLLPPDDPRINLVFPGVRQDHLGRAYREGVRAGGSPCFVDATDSRSFAPTDGRFETDTLHVVVTDGDETYRAGSKSHFHVPEVEERRMPAKYWARGKDGVSRPVG